MSKISPLLTLIAPPKGYTTQLNFKNCTFHNSKDFSKKTILLCWENNIFKSICDDKNIAPGQLFMFNHHRAFFNLELDTKISCKEYISKTTFISSIQISITPQKKTDVLTIHEEIFSSFIKNQLCNDYFYKNQIYFINYENITCILNTATNEEGCINDKTKINFISQNINVKIISSNLLKPELFSPDFNFKDYGLGGLNNEMKKIFTETLSTRSISPELVKLTNLKHVKGILLHGPPGTGKTLIARNLGKILTDDEPTVINGPEVISSYVGKTEENIRNIFANAISNYKSDKEKSKLHIFIFDEIDAICKKRGGGASTLSNVNDNIVNQLLSLIDGVNALDNIFIIAMTNRIDLLDSALLRAGRIEVHIKINLPDYEGRIEILNIHTKKIRENNMLSYIDINQIANMTENYSGAELEALVRKSISYAIHEKIAKGIVKKEDIIITMNHFERAIAAINPLFGNTVSKYDLSHVIMLKEYKNKCKTVLSFLNSSINIASMLIYGDKGSGKSTFINVIAAKANITYTKIIKAIDIVTMYDVNKIDYLVTILKEANLSKKSLIIIDDIEIFLEYSLVDMRSVYSIKLFNAILMLLKFTPEPGNNIRIIINCGNNDLSHILEPYFDKYIMHEFLDDILVKKMAKKLGIKNIDEHVSKISTIRQLLEYK